MTFSVSLFVEDESYTRISISCEYCWYVWCGAEKYL